MQIECLQTLNYVDVDSKIQKSRSDIAVTPV